MSLRFDTRDFERMARRIGALADQIPFALAQALNDGAEKAREQLPQTWAQHVTVRNARFLKAALTTKGARATKRSLRVELRDRFGRGNLNLHDEGGIRRPRGSAIAIPSKTNLQPRRGAHGVPKALRPRNVPNSFVKPSKYGPVLFQRVGTYQKATPKAKTAAAKDGTKRAKGNDGRHLKVMYGLAQSTRIKADVPLHRDFETIMQREVRRAFKVRISAAMTTAFRK